MSHMINSWSVADGVSQSAAVRDLQFDSVQLSSVRMLWTSLNVAPKIWSCLPPPLLIHFVVAWRLLSAGLPIHLAPLLLRLGFGFCWQLCAFINYLCLLTAGLSIYCCYLFITPKVAQRNITITKTEEEHERLKTKNTKYRNNNANHTATVVHASVNISFCRMSFKVQYCSSNKQIKKKLQGILSWEYRSPRKRPAASVILCWIENILLIKSIDLLVCLHWKIRRFMTFFGQQNTHLASDRNCKRTEDINRSYTSQLMILNTTSRQLL